MQVMDIVNRACIESGCAPSFNVDDVPEDMQARAADILRHEIIPDLNCDRSVDITEIVYPATPVNGVISLRTPPLDYPRFIIPTAPLTAKELLSSEEQYNPDTQSSVAVVNLLVYLRDSGYVTGLFDVSPTGKWPTDQFGNPLELSVWTNDFKLIEIQSDFSQYYGKTEDVDWVDKKYNVPFAPMRVEEVARAGDGAIFQYIHAGEMISSEFRYSPLVYTVEDLPDVVNVRFNKTYCDGPVLLVLPIPLTIVNSPDSPDPWRGELVAPVKFRMFITATLAYRMAGEYGLATEARCEKLAAKAYGNIIKNLSKRSHPQDIPRKISAYLERNRGWRSGVNGSGYAGGFNG